MTIYGFEITQYLRLLIFYQNSSHSEKHHAKFEDIVSKSRFKVLL